MRTVFDHDQLACDCRLFFSREWSSFALRLFGSEKRISGICKARCDAWYLLMAPCRMIRNLPGLLRLAAKKCGVVKNVVVVVLSSRLMFEGARWDVVSRPSFFASHQ